MASIIQRNGKYCVIISYKDDTGKRRQKWKTFATKKEAKEYAAQADKTFIKRLGEMAAAPKTVDELMDEYIRNYGQGKWSFNYYAKVKSLMNYYISPFIGKEKLESITPRFIEAYYRSLLEKESAQSTKEKRKLISAKTVDTVHEVLHSAFNQAVRWDILDSNPIDKAIPPRYKEKRRDIWEADDLKKALAVCEDPILALCINLGFSCSLRLGEILGLTWDCVHISDDLIRENAAWILVNKQLQRVSKEAVDSMKTEEIFRRFPLHKINSYSVLILKQPKTESSVRKIYLPKTVALMLRERKEKIEEYKQYLGDDFNDNDLVICYEYGTPYEPNKIRKALEKLIAENGLKPVVFHSLRHSSVTYKLKLSGGNIKAVQGDTGHAEADMITERYAHIIDDDRRINAEKFEEQFYRGNGENSGGASVSEIVDLINKLKERSELLELLRKI